MATHYESLKNHSIQGESIGFVKVNYNKRISNQSNNQITTSTPTKSMEQNGDK